MQEKLFIQWGRFFSPKVPTLFFKRLTAVVSGQQGAEAIDPGSTLYRANFFIFFTDIY